MIHINLLPPEFRKRSRTPIKLMIGFSAAVTVNALCLTWLGWLSFGVAAEVKGQRSVLQLEVEGLRPQVAYHESLETERGQYKDRETTLAQVTQSRVSWTRKMDELIDVVNQGGEGERHFVWLDDLVVAEARDARSGSAGTVKAAGHSGSDNFAQVANFLEDLETSPFISDFHPPAPPEGTQTDVDEDLIPSEVWSFPLALNLKKAEERQ